MPGFLEEFNIGALGLGFRVEDLGEGLRLEPLNLQGLL